MKVMKGKMKVMKGKMRQVLAILLIVAMVVTTIQISPAQAQAATDENKVTTYYGDGFDVTFKVSSQWSSAFNADVTINNTSDKVIDNWTLEFLMPYEITNIWNGIIDSHENGNYIIKNVGSNQDIGIQQSVSFGFTANLEDELILPTQYSLLCYEEVLPENSYEAVFKETDDWTSAFNGEISIKNISDQVIEDWKLEFDFDGKIDRFWTAEILSQKDSHYVIKNAGYNANIKPGETISLGFSGTPGNVVSNIENYKLTQIVSTSPIEYIELVDGKIEKDYLNRVIYPNLLMDGKSIDDIKLSNDFDSDGLTLGQEYEYDTNPFSADTDEDGLCDYEEIYLYNTDPNNSDSDWDEMTDGTEINCALNPLLADTDGNGIIDCEETIKQQVRIEGFEKNTLEEVGTLPSVIITGKGDYSEKLNAVAITNDKTILEINSLVGTPFDLVHDDNMTFESSEISFQISDEILKTISLDELVIASYDKENNALELLDTRYDEVSHTISADVNHYSIYFAINIEQYFFDIDWKNESSKIESGKADVIFVVDTTGSMYDAIQNVKNNINQFVTELDDKKVDIRLGLIEYQDITYDGTDSTKSYSWYNDVNDFKKQVSALGLGDGGDIPESAVDALHCAQNMKFRSGVNKYIILVTDASYKNGIVGDSSVTMQDEIDKLVKNNVSTSVVTRTSCYSTYQNLTSSTNGVTGNIVNNFANELKPLIEKMKENAKGCWVRLSNGSVVRLDSDPALGDETVDTDEDGIPDVIELKSSYKVLVFNPYTQKTEFIDTWSFYSNPVDEDSDGDEIYDVDDLRPTIYDTTIKNKTDEYIEFNTKRKWYNVSCTSFDYLDNLCQFVDGYVDNYIPIEEFRKIIDNIELNSEQEFSIEELTIIGLINNEGSKIYLNDKSSEIRETIFHNLTNQDSKYFKHSGILWWEEWKEVAKGTKGGFLKGTVLSEADINFSLKLYYETDVYTVLNTVAKVGALVIAVIVAIEATPTILANIQGLIYYVKTFGVYQGLKMYEYLGVSNLPSSVITWVQWDVADGDSSLDDLIGANIPIHQRGITGEEALKITYGGDSQVYFEAYYYGVKGGRYIDQLANDIAHESKVGYTCLSNRIRIQILKDAYLLEKEEFKKVIWHFYKSDITGRGGATQSLLDFLEENGIEYIIH